MDDLAVFGAAEDLLEDIRHQQQQAARFEVHDDCWPTVEVFLAADTQWRLDGGIAIGLDFSGVLAVLRFLSRRPAKELFSELRLMEGAALKALNEIRAKRRNRQ